MVWLDGRVRGRAAGWVGASGVGSAVLSAQQDSDTAVAYLMVGHVAHGDLRSFYWGHAYRGPMLQLTAGALFRLVGSSFIGLQVVEIGFWLRACLLVRPIVARACGVLAGAVAACLFWLATPFVFVELLGPWLLWQWFGGGRSVRAE